AVLRPSAGGDATATQSAAPTSGATASPAALQPTPGSTTAAPPPSPAAEPSGARPARAAQLARAQRAATPSAISSSPTSLSEAHASPSVRKLGRELGVDLGRVRGSGNKGRVTADDVKAFVKEIMLGGGPAARGPALPAVPTVDFAKFGPVETEPLSR